MYAFNLPGPDEVVSTTELIDTDGIVLQSAFKDGSENLFHSFDSPLIRFETSKSKRCFEALTNHADRGDLSFIVGSFRRPSFASGDYSK